MPAASACPPIDPVETPPTSLARRTLRRTASIEGPGLFSGQPVGVTLHPRDAGAADPGIRFSVRDAHGVNGHPPVLAHVANVRQQPRHTVLQGEGFAVETVEHLLAALAGLGVTDADIELADLRDADAAPEGAVSLEVPMGDGSSRVFVDAVGEAGVVPLAGAARPLVIDRPIYVNDGDSTLAALPGPTDALEIIYSFDGPAPVGRQAHSFRLNHGEAPSDGGPFLSELAGARTFIFAAEAEALKQRGWGGHLSYSDLLVLDADGPLGGNALRWPDEPVRHKVLDLIGDLSLVGRPLCGRIVAHKSGHALNHQLARALLEADAEKNAGPSVSPFAHLLGRPGAEAALDIRKIQRILPHRFPMLLVDRVLEIDGDQRAVGVKNVTMGDVYFLGHYPQQPIFPGVLIVEAMGQLGGILLSRKLEHTGKIAVLLSMDGVKMRQSVTPGDQLVLVAEAVRVKSRTGHVRCEAYVGAKLAAEADIKFMLVDAE